MSIFIKYKDLIEDKENININNILSLSNNDIKSIVNILNYYKEDILDNIETFDLYINYLNFLTKQNILEAYVDLGDAYRFSTKFYEDANEKAIEYYNIAAVNGYPEVYIRIGHIYMMERMNIVQDENKLDITKFKDQELLEKELNCYLKAEENNIKEAFLELGDFYKFTGDIRKAKEYYLKSMEVKDFRAINSLSSCEDSFNKINNDALRYLSVDENDIDSLLLMATTLQYGLGIDKDINEALRLYNIAASKGSEEAMERLFLKYMRKGTQFYDFNKAFDLCLKLCDLGNSNAQNYLANHYRNNFEFELAAKYYKLSADNGNEHGAYGLSELYKLGLGVKKDFKEYVRYYRLSISLSKF